MEPSFEELTAAKLVTNFQFIYGTQHFITIFTKAHLLSLAIFIFSIIITTSTAIYIQVFSVIYSFQIFGINFYFNSTFVPQNSDSHFANSLVILCNESDLHKTPKIHISRRISIDLGRSKESAQLQVHVYISYRIFLFLVLPCWVVSLPPSTQLNDDHLLGFRAYLFRKFVAMLQQCYTFLCLCVEIYVQCNGVHLEKIYIYIYI